MPRPAGMQKTGGRQRGTPNKKTRLLEEQLNALGLDVPARLTELLPQLDPDRQVQVLLEVMNYLYPKRKAIDQKIEVAANARSTDEYDQLSDDELRARLIEKTKHTAQLLGLSLQACRTPGPSKPP